MNKFLLPLLLVLSFVVSAQKESVVSDEVKARNVLQIPRYSTLPGYGKLGGLVDVYMTTDSGVYVRRPWGWFKVNSGNYADYQGTRFEGQPVITWSGVGLIYNVFCPRYWINGVEHKAINSSVTLAAAPITQSRIDVIYANHLNNLGVLQGDSSISPIKKSVDELTQIEIGSIYLNPGDTTPPNLRIEWVYREGIEWDTINTMTHINPLVFRSPIAPLNGTYNIRAGCYGPGSRFSFDAPEPIAVDSFQSFSFWIKLNSTLFSGMSMQGYNGNSPSSRKIPLLRGVWGLNPNFPGWQKLQVPMSQFFAGRMIGKLIFSMDESDCTNWQIDDISFQANVATISTPDVKWITIQADSGSITAKSNADILKAKGRGGIRTIADSSGFYIDASGVSGGGGGANNYPTSLGFSSGVLTLGRNGLSALSANLDGRWLKYTDTAGLWVAKAVFLAHADSVAAALATKLNIADTVPFVRSVTRTPGTTHVLVDGVLAYEDSVGVGAPPFDSTSLSNRINGKLNISDSAAMLVPYLRSAVAAVTYVGIAAYNTHRDSVATALAGKISGALNNGRIPFVTGSNTLKDTTILSYDRANAAVGIGTATPNANASLTLENTSKFFLPNRWTTTQMNALTGVVAGAQGFNLSNNQPYWFNGTSWFTSGMYYINANYRTTNSGLLGSGTGNVGIGDSSLSNLSTGLNNIAIGSFAGSKYNGDNMIALGTDALRNSTVLGHAIGINALKANTTGVGNVALATNALTANTTGTNNVAAGVQSLSSNITGSFNTATGGNALQSSLTSNNTANGYYSLQSLTTGVANTVCGSAEGINITVTTGSYNAGVGAGVLVGMGPGSYNVGVGYKALYRGYNNTTKSTAFNYNTAIGAFALSLTSSTGTIAMGFETGTSDSAIDKDIFIGNGTAVGVMDSKKNIVIGDSIMRAVGTFTTKWGINNSIAIGVSPRDTTGLSDYMVFGTSNIRRIEFKNNSVQINTTGSNQSMSTSAALDIPSSNKGLLIPRMTKAARNLIVSPDNGLIIYQTDNTPGLRTWNGTNWMKYTETAD